MANFRAERLFIRIQEPIDGFDPNQGIDVEEFAWTMVCDQKALERDSLSKFTIGPGDKPRWFPAEAGLKVVRACLAEVGEKAANAELELQKQGLQNKIAMLKAVENRLDTIDTYDRKFYFQARDLG